MRTLSIYKNELLLCLIHFHLHRVNQCGGITVE